MNYSISHEENVKTIAFKLVSGAVDIARSMILANPERTFVYSNFLYDGLRPERKSSYAEPTKESKKLFNKNVIIPKRDTIDKTHEMFKKYWEKRHEYDNHSIESIKTIQSKRYSYSFNEPQTMITLQPSYEDTRRSTFEDIVFKKKARKSYQVELWNYAMSDNSSDTGSELEKQPDIAEEIQDLKEIMYKWPTIRDFSLDKTLTTIQEFVSLWKLAPTIRFALLDETPSAKSCLGERFHVTVAFSQPTPMCPNPLAVAYVYFEIHCSFVMPVHFPIMVTYRFETFKHNYHALGKGNMRSITFQNYFIESILKTKLLFYVELFEAAHGSLWQKPKKFTVDEEYEMYRRQHENAQNRYSASQESAKSLNVLSTSESTLNKEKFKLSGIIKSRIYKKSVEIMEPWKVKELKPVDIEKSYKKVKMAVNSEDLDAKTNSHLNLVSSLAIFELDAPKQNNIKEIDKKNQ